MPKRYGVPTIPASESLAANRPRRKASLGAAAKVAQTASEEAEEDDDDDCLIIPASQVPQSLKTPQPPRKRSWRPTNVEVDLLMECMDDELSPWQREANRLAEKEYNAAMERIKHAKAQAEANAQHINASQSTTNIKHKIGNAGEEKGDVIIIDEEPPQGVLQAQLAAPPAQLGMQHVVLKGPHGQSQSLLPSNFSAISHGTPVQPQKPYQIGQASPHSKARSPSGRKQSFIVRDVEVVSGTSGLGIKRLGSAPTGPVAKRRCTSVSDTNTKKDDGSWVPLEQYYYSKKEGDPTYWEEKAEFRFKCWYCHKMLYNNLRIMMHMQGHIDSEKQQNLDLSDLTQCKHCYKQFDTPFEMQCHIERVHQNQSNVLVCRICEKDHETQATLRQHMRNYHTICEMPYICQLCNFRSSIYSDVVDHFKKRHDSSQYTLCLYCLRVFKINFSKLSGWGLTQNYYQHIQKHQVKNNNKKCPCCKLTFLNKPDVTMHRNKDHLPNYRGAGNFGKSARHSLETVMIQVPQAGTKPKAGALKSLNAPAVSKVRELRGIRLAVSQRLSSFYCIECRSPMASADHYKKYVECSMCRYATTCNIAYAKHMMALHSGNHLLELTIVPKEKKLGQRMFCLCGFSSVYGNKIASHLVFCSKRTTYFRKPETRWFEYDDEQEEFNPFEPYVEEPDVPEAESPKRKEEMTLLGVLGLMKKKTESPLPSPKEESSLDIANQMIASVLEAVFPAEAAADEFIGKLLDHVDAEIQAKVAVKEVAIRRKNAEASAAAAIAAQVAKGGCKSGVGDDVRWSPTKTQDGKSPSKMSIFSGGHKQKDKQRAEVGVEEMQDVVCLTSQEELVSQDDSQGFSSSKDLSVPRSDSTSQEDSRDGSASGESLTTASLIKSRGTTDTEDSVMESEPADTGVVTMPTSESEMNHKEVMDTEASSGKEEKSAGVEIAEYRGEIIGTEEESFAKVSQVAEDNIETEEHMPGISPKESQIELSLDSDSSSHTTMERDTFEPAATEQEAGKDSTLTEEQKDRSKSTENTGADRMSKEATSTEKTIQETQFEGKDQESEESVSGDSQDKEVSGKELSKDNVGKANLVLQEEKDPKPHEKMAHSVDPKSHKDHVPSGEINSHKENSNSADPKSQEEVLASGPKQYEEGLPTADPESQEGDFLGADPKSPNEGLLGADPKSHEEDIPSIDPKSHEDDIPSGDTKLHGDDIPSVDPKSHEDDIPSVDPKSHEDDIPSVDPKSHEDDIPSVDPKSHEDDIPSVDPKSHEDDIPSVNPKSHEDDIPSVDLKSHADDIPSVNPKSHEDDIPSVNPKSHEDDNLSVVPKLHKDKSQKPVLECHTASIQSAASKSGDMKASLIRTDEAAANIQKTKPSVEKTVDEQVSPSKKVASATGPQKRESSSSNTSSPEKKSASRSSDHQPSNRSSGSGTSYRSSSQSHYQHRDERRRDSSEYHRSEKSHDNRSRDYDSHHRKYDHHRSDDRYRRDDHHTGQNRSNDYRSSGYQYNRYDDRQGGQYHDRNRGRGGFQHHHDRPGYYRNRGGPRGGHRGGYQGGY